MKINKHIQEIESKLALNPNETKMLQHAWDNRQKRDFACVNIASVSSSGMSRQFKVVVQYKGEFVNITRLISKVTKVPYNKNKDTISLSGCGMDMGFALLESFYSYLIPNNQKIQPHNLSAVQNYFYL